MLLAQAKFRPLTEFKRSHRAIRAAHKAETPVKTFTRGELTWTEGGEADHAIRLQAARENLKLADAYPDHDRDGDTASRPVNVAIILTHANGHAGTPLQSHGVRLHLDGDNGHGA